MMYIINEYAQNFTTDYSFQQFPKITHSYPFLTCTYTIYWNIITLWLCNVSNIAKPIIHNNDITLFEVVKSTVCLTCSIRGAFGER